MIKGAAFKFGDNVDTDAIISARYLVTADPKDLAPHCMETADRDFAKKAKPGDLLIAGRNFGCGSSREHAPLSIKGLGLGLIVAESFARIFFRNCINIGMPILECAEAAQEALSGDLLEADLDRGEIRNLTRGTTYKAATFPPFMQQIIQSGGLMPFVRKRLMQRDSIDGGQH